LCVCVCVCVYVCIYVCMNVCMCIHTKHTHTRRIYIYIYIYTHRVSQKDCARLREGVPYVKVYQYNTKHLCPKLNGYGDNGQRKV